MKPHVKKMWVEALESGKYRLGKHYLRKSGKNGDQFCCLGVLCDLAPRRLGKWDKDNDGYTFDGTPDVLPHDVVDWAGLEDTNPRVRDGTDTLAQMNDRGCSFKTIAKVIREQL